jgi:hypothetical protein
VAWEDGRVDRVTIGATTAPDYAVRVTLRPYPDAEIAHGGC